MVIYRNPPETGLTLPDATGIKTDQWDPTTCPGVWVFCPFRLQTKFWQEKRLGIPLDSRTAVTKSSLGDYRLQPEDHLPCWLCELINEPLITYPSLAEKPHPGNSTEQTVSKHLISCDWSHSPEPPSCSAIPEVWQRHHGKGQLPAATSPVDIVANSPQVSHGRPPASSFLLCLELSSSFSGRGGSGAFLNGGTYGHGIPPPQHPPQPQATWLPQQTPPAALPPTLHSNCTLTGRAYTSQNFNFCTSCLI